MTQAAQASELIDLIADAMDGQKGKKRAYRAGREILIAWYAMHPKATYAVGQGSKYIFARLEMDLAA
jgi:hypothetical protein